MSYRRSRFQIFVEVLTAIYNGEQTPTRIMYNCNLSWNSLNETLELLVKKGYLYEIYDKKNRKNYNITYQGKEILGYYAGLKNLINIK